MILWGMLAPYSAAMYQGLPASRAWSCVYLGGLVVAALSVTGVVIWWKKRKARVARRVRT